MSRADRFLKACRREAVDTTPVWMMRQAGRYLPEYRALREKHDFLTMVHTPELAVEVTLQPIRRFELDAAIIFADILPLLAAMGLDLRFIKGDGPSIDNPVSSPTDIGALATPDPRESLDFTLEAIRQTRRELNGKVPLIGFSGAPFTLAAYAIEGGGSRDYQKAKRFMHTEPKAWYQFMDKLAKMVGEYLRAQVEAGAQAIQLFDSWVGNLSPCDYREYVLPHTRRAIHIARNGDGARVPIIYFGTDTAGLFPLIRELETDVVGVDWRIDLNRAWQELGEVAVQGNLDPQVLLATPEVIRKQAARVLDTVQGRAGHIFNLGHGISRETPPEHAAVLIDFVHEYARRDQPKSSTREATCP